MKKAQASMDYLLLIGAAVMFTIVVTLSTREVLISGGEETNIKVAEIIATQQVLITSKPSLLIPSVPEPSTIVQDCNPGESCSGPKYCHFNTGTWYSCNGYVCDSSGFCSSPTNELATCSPCGSKTQIFGEDECPVGETNTSWCASSCDFGCDAGSGFCNSDCTPAPCAVTCAGGGPPSCTVNVDITGGEGPFVSVVNVTFNNPVPGMDDAIITCNSTDPGTVIPINTPENSTGNIYCYFPATSSIQTFNITAHDVGPLPYATCTTEIMVGPSMTCAFTEGGSVNTGGNSINIGPFSTNLVVTYADLEPGVTSALMKCKATDPEVVVPINLTAATSQLICSYPGVLGATSFDANAIACGNYSCASCIQNITDAAPPIIPDLCNINACDIITKPLHSAVPTFLDFRVEPRYYLAPITEIRIMDSLYSCSNPPIPPNTCKNDPCRVRGAQVGQNYCVIIEDQIDYDWNDFVFSSHTITYPNGDMLVEVVDEACDTAAADALVAMFDFGSNTYVRDMENSASNFSSSTEYEVWNRCHFDLGLIRHFFVSTSAAPANRPPKWLTIALRKDTDPIMRKIPSIGQSASYDGLYNLQFFITDDHDAKDLISFAIVDYNSTALDCGLSGPPVVNPANLTCTGLANGYYTVKIKATDTSGYYSNANFWFKVG
ncbi:MAG: hypothetical protein ABH863_01310 [Candidatus Micrarchaeota archaeon]